MAAKVEPKGFDVFLSHHSEDTAWVSTLKWRLEASGISVWLDKDEIRPGDHFIDALEAGLEHSRCLVLVVSPEAMRSGWVREEYHRALRLSNDPGQEVRIIPVILRMAEIPGFLAARHHVDFQDESQFDEKLEELVFGITGSKPAVGRGQGSPTSTPVAATSASSLTWLHLSDFHFKANTDWQRDAVLKSLERDVIATLAPARLSPDLVFISGDIAYSGQADEYTRAAEYFTHLRKNLIPSVPLEQWFVVPGNHDVDRNTKPALMET